MRVADVHLGHQGDCRPRRVGLAYDTAGVHRAAGGLLGPAAGPAGGAPSARDSGIHALHQRHAPAPAAPLAADALERPRRHAPRRRHQPHGRRRGHAGIADVHHRAGHPGGVASAGRCVCLPGRARAAAGPGRSHYHAFSLDCQQDIHTAHAAHHGANPPRGERHTDVPTGEPGPPHAAVDPDGH